MQADGMTLIEKQGFIQRIAQIQEEQFQLKRKVNEMEIVLE